MKLNTNRFAMATAISFSVLWVICSALVALAPKSSAYLTNIMLHAKIPAPFWILTWEGFFIGLITWSIVGGITAWLITFVYNHLH